MLGPASSKTMTVGGWAGNSLTMVAAFALMALGVLGQQAGNVTNNGSLQYGNDYGQHDELLDSMGISDEKRLLLVLERRYRHLGKDGRPVRNASLPVVVNFGLGLIKMELQEKENMLSMSTWTRYRWKDEYLQWNPDDYGGTKVVKMSYDKIWNPDIMLYNTANTDEGERKVMAVITWEGYVTWYPHKMFQSSCAVDVRDFPFDNQTCYMWFGSWTHTMDEVDLHLAFPGGVDLSTFKAVYKDASEWEIINCTAERIEMPPEGERYAILSFTLQLRRKMMFSTYILTMPAIFMSFLTLLVFWLPPEHADKSALGLTIFGSMLLLLLILVEAAPPTASAVPLLGVFYCFTTVIVILSVFLSSLVVKLGQADKLRRPLPRWIRRMLLGQVASRLLCVGCASNPPASNSLNSTELALACEPSEKEPLDPKESCIISSLATSADDPRANGVHSSAVVVMLERRLRALQTLLHDLISRQLEKEQREKAREEIASEWRNLAMVLDRLFFVCYLAVIITSLVLFFPRGMSV